MNSNYLGDIKIKRKVKKENKGNKAKKTVFESKKYSKNTTA